MLDIALERLQPICVGLDGGIAVLIDVNARQIKLLRRVALYPAGLSRLDIEVERHATPMPPIERIGNAPWVFSSPMPYIE